MLSLWTLDRLHPTFIECVMKFMFSFLFGENFRKFMFHIQFSIDTDQKTFRRLAPCFQLGIISRQNIKRSKLFIHFGSILGHSPWQLCQNFRRLSKIISLLPTKCMYYQKTRTQDRLVNTFIVSSFRTISLCCHQILRFNYSNHSLFSEFNCFLNFH